MKKNNFLFCGLTGLLGAMMTPLHAHQNDGIIPLKNIKEVTPHHHVCAQPEFIGTLSQMQNKYEIPKRIFQTWKTHTLPETFEKWSNTWKKNNPTWEYQLWDDNDNRNFIKNNYAWFLPIYDSFPKEIYRADAVRYFYLYQFGGVYADLDFECVKSLEPLTDSGCVILGKMSQVDHIGQYPNAFMASPPKADFWLVVIYLMMNSMPGLRPEFTTGPAIIRQALFTYSHEPSRLKVLQFMSRYMNDSLSIPICIRPPCELYPIDWLTKTYTKTPCTYAITWWTATWKESLNLGHERDL
jgi:inositol phosphorylceramide mannosyltransferase catalytic subunit